jgi:CBS domain-containing protein
MTLQELSREDVVSAEADAPVSQVAETMRDENVGSVVVTNENHPIGIVTDRDLTTRVLAEEADPADQTTDEVMSTDLCAVGPDAGFYEAAQVMSENGIRRLPVCDENDELVGIITADDLSELIANEQNLLAEVLRNQRPDY